MVSRCFITFTHRIQQAGLHHPLLGGQVITQLSLGYPSPDGLEGKASRLREKIRAYEEKYGLSSRELVRLWDDAVAHKKGLPLPDGADLDLIEWRSLYEIYEALLNDIESRLL